MYENQLYEEMYRFYLKGYSLQEVAKQFGLTRQVVYTGFKRRGFKLRSKNFNKFVVYDGKNSLLEIMDIMVVLLEKRITTQI